MTNKRNIILAVSLTVGLVLLHIWLGEIAYEVNDEVGIIAQLKGLFGRPPVNDGVFISPVLGTALFLGYKFFPALPWFSLLLYIGMCLSCFMAIYTVLESDGGLWGKLACLLGVVVFITQLLLLISFTATCLMLWIVSCAFLFLAVKNGSPWGVAHWFAAGQLALAYLLRPGLAPILMVFSVPLLLIVLQRGSRIVSLRIFLPLLVVAVLGGICNMLPKGEEYERYERFNQIRGEFTDTARSSRTDSTSQALFAADWSFEDYTVMKNWWFHDGNIFSSEKIEKFLDLNANVEQKFSFNFFKLSLKDNFVLILLLFTWGGIWLLPTLKVKKNLLWVLVFTGMILAVFVLMGVRFPRRVALPGFFMLFLYGYIMADGPPLRSRLMSVISNMCVILVVSGVLVFFIPAFREGMASYPGRLGIKNYLDRTLFAVTEANGPDTLLVDVNPHILPLNYFPFTENDPILQTAVLGTGWLVDAPVYLDQLQNAGLGGRATAVSSMIDNPRVVLRFWDSGWLVFNNYVRGAFLRHLRQHYTVAGSGRKVDVQVFRDFRQNGNGMIYFRLVTVPDNE